MRFLISHTADKISCKHRFRTKLKMVEARRKRDFLIGWFVPRVTWLWQDNLLCLISWRAGDWHYRIFADFVLVLYSRYSNPKTHLKCESKLSIFEAIKCDISPENLPSLGKESLKQYCKELRLKVTGEKQELVERLAPLGKSAELFQKKVLRISQTYKFSTSLEPSEVPPPSANWKIIGRNEDPNVPVVNENTIRDYQKAKYAGKKGQYRKAHLMFSSRRITSVKMMESNSKRSFVKANILKSYTGSI